MEQLTTDILIVGGGTGGTAAAIQAARRGVKTILVSEFSWLGGMLTSAGVAAPDGNELAAWQTGIWGAYLKTLQQRQPGGLDNAWVSLFTYEPHIGAKILADWVQQLPNLHWLSGQIPLEVLQQGNRITGVRFTNFIIKAKITIDGTELGDLLALGDIPHRWGWELQSGFNEPSAPITFNELTDKYPVQSPTWVFLLRDYKNSNSPVISPASNLPYSPSSFQGAWDNYGGKSFLNYGRLPGDLLMINWPIQGNDYGENLGRLIASETSRQEFLKEAYWHSQNFAHFIQAELGERYGFADNIFPHPKNNLFQNSESKIKNAFALHPYYRESRRLQGKTTITEKDILPISGKSFASLPLNNQEEITSIAIGNYANDHHYPGVEFTLQPKSILWGGRWTGTPFTIPYHALISHTIDGFLVCEKNISVSHIANGSTRLQPLVMNIGQAAGMAAALCIELNCQPREVPVRKLQEALLTDSIAPSAVIPLFNLPPENPDWLYWQQYYLEHPNEYLSQKKYSYENILFEPNNCYLYKGIFQYSNFQDYSIILNEPTEKADQICQLITTRPEVNQQLQELKNNQALSILGRFNASGNWLLVEKITENSLS